MPCPLKLSELVRMSVPTSIVRPIVHCAGGGTRTRKAAWSGSWTFGSTAAKSVKREFDRDRAEADASCVLAPHSGLVKRGSARTLLLLNVMVVFASKADTDMSVSLLFS